MNRSAGPALSIVVPVFNEESNVEPFYQAVKPVLLSLGLSSDIIFVDDGSTDRSFERISALAKNDATVKCLRFSRNFGSHAALTAGLRRTRADAAVIISADLQDPPELIPDLVRRWRDGAHVVWAVREGRDDPYLRRLFAAAFYRLFRRLALPNYPAAGMDFGLFDRKVLDQLNSFEEVNHFVTGLIVWLGFRQDQVPYHRRARARGYSKWPFRKRLRTALDAFLSFSGAPVRVISTAGMLLLLLALAGGAWLSADWIAGRMVSTPRLIVVSVLFLAGLQLATLGVLGEYIYRGLEQTKGRPPFVVMDAIGFEGSTAESAE